MKLELRGESLPKEPVARLYLRHAGDELSLCYEDENGNGGSLAFFDTTANTFHVFVGDLKKIGYTLTTDRREGT